jgi:hypothetical protein
MQERLFSVYLTLISKWLPLRNTPQYDINCFKFNRGHKTEKCSCLRVNSYGRGIASIEMPNSNNTPDFCFRQFQT